MLGDCPLKNPNANQLDRIEAKLDRLLAYVDAAAARDGAKLVCPACGGEEFVAFDVMGDDPDSRFICAGERGCGKVLKVK